MGPSAASRALDEILEEGGELAERVKKESGMHRTRLHTYRKGKGKPDADGIAKLHRITGGRIPADGWEDDPPLSERNPTPGSKAAS